MRVPIVGGNWKMNTDLASARGLAGEVVVGLAGMDEASSGRCEVVLFPPFPYLTSVGSVIRGSGIHLGAQDVYFETKGAFTGEVSAAMLRDVDVTHVIVGHSERRHVIAPGEDDAIINRKLRAAVEAGLTTVFCIGEKLEEREEGRTEEVTLRQLEAGLKDVEPATMERVVIAYEPVWAIGTGRNASPEDAQKVHKRLRQALRTSYNGAIADSVRIQYGGSVTSENARSLFQQPDIDGGLIGGASLKSGEFLAIIKGVSRSEFF